MNVTELRIAGAFDLPDAHVDDEVDVVLRVRIYSIERDSFDVSGASGYESVPGGLRVQAVAIDEGGAGVREPVAPAPESPGDAIAADYAESAE